VGGLGQGGGRRGCSAHTPSFSFLSTGFRFQGVVRVVADERGGGIEVGVLVGGEGRGGGGRGVVVLGLGCRGSGRWAG